jgi:hypothetical protein
MGESIQVEFTKEKETKNAVRFAEVLEDGMDRGIVGSIYVLKEYLEDLNSPEKIIVTITPVG